MQFKHPEILFALFLLIIPIIVHLFQLQRFLKVPFTNVKFLKQVILQTRKSSQLKKWIILVARMLAFTALIFAFAQPFFSNADQETKYRNIIYLDNSLSMQAKIEGVELLKKAGQKIIENSTNLNNVTLLTNDNSFKNLTSDELKNTIINLDYSTKKQNLNSILLRANQSNNNQTKTLNKIALLSDFQFILKNKNQSVTNVNSSISLVNLQNSNFSNARIDSVFIAKKSSTEITLKVLISTYNNPKNLISVSLFNDEILIGKSSVENLENQFHEVEFIIPNQEFIHGRVSLDDAFLEFDNDLYFSISKPEKIKVLSIGNPQPYLAKIFTSDEFEFVQQFENLLDYNFVKQQHLIIVNELVSISEPLKNVIADFTRNGGTLLVIPAVNADLNSYNALFNALEAGQIGISVNNNLKITSINYNHPILSGVFEKEITNFQYPEVNQYYPSNFRNASNILTFENLSTFINQSTVQAGKLYWCASPLSTTSTNFSSSPLIVPILYNIGKESFNSPKLYYSIGIENKLTTDISLGKDEVLTLNSVNSTIIPLQQINYNNVQITTSDKPDESGFFTLNHKNTALKTLAFNYDRKESDFAAIDLNERFKDVSNITINTSIEDTLTQLKELQQIKPLFKWFLTLAVVFLLLEICILNFFKI